MTIKEKGPVKRSVGRPRLGKIKVILSIDPAVLVATDKSAKAKGLGRSAFVEAILRSALIKKGLTDFTFPKIV